MAKRSLKNDTAEKNTDVLAKTDYSSNGNNNTGPASNNTRLQKEDLVNVLRYMLLARSIDNKAMNLLRQGKTFFHISGAGHEAIQIAVSMLTDAREDWLFPYYRDLAITLHSGVTPYEFFLQCFAKADDPSCGGKQLPCHWGTNRSLNIPAQSSPTGTQFLNAVGTALAVQKQNKKSISYVSSGEGTTSQGEFHEAVNWASREKLPVLFVIENNKYAISVHVSEQSGGKDNSIAEMMSGYDNLYRARIDGTDFYESYNTVQAAVEYIRSGKGPALIEAEVVRLQSHSSSDDQKKYRPKKELEEELRKCPIEKLAKNLIENEYITKEDYETLKMEAAEQVDKAADEAAKAADPVPSDATRFIFDESGYKDTLDYESAMPSGKPIVMVDAINHALHEEMERNNNIYVFGEDVADHKGGVFTATKGLSTKFSGRVFNSPLAEASIVGVANGMALAGLKPVVEIQFGDYIWPAFMQYKNEMATFRYRSNNAWSAPVVSRVAVGGYIHGGLYHSQNIESIFAHIPGIYIAYPSNAADAKGLLKTACRINDPVLFCEHKGLYRQSFATSPEPDENYLVPFGKAKVVYPGTDLTVISYGVSLWDSVLAAKKLADEGYSVEVIDIRTIVPLDEETIYNSVKKTNKAIVIHEDTYTAGFGAEIASRISENCFSFLDGPVRRIAAKDSHIPYSPILENAVLPNREEIYNGIKNLLEY
jgi:2-oxoisovalerate dehydrogenase E1 component